MGMVYYYEGVLMPARTKWSHIAGLHGFWSDLYPRWLGAHELLLHGRNPYSPEVTQDIQRGFYGRVVDSSNPKVHLDTEAFVYPVYVVFLLAPSLWFPFEAVRVVFTFVIVLLTAFSVPMWMRVLGMPIRRRILVISLLFTMCSYPTILGLQLDQITLLIAPIIAGSLVGIAEGRFFLSGLMLALAMTKPQLALPVLLFLTLWTLLAWKERKGFAIGFASLMLPLLIASEMVLPGWFGDWRQAAHEYLQEHGQSFVAFCAGNLGTIILGGTGVLLCAWLCWRARNEGPGSEKFNYALVSTLVLTGMLMPNAGLGGYNEVILIPVVLWMFTRGWKLAKRRIMTRVTWLLAFNVLAWQWIWASCVSFAALFLGYQFDNELAHFVATPKLLVFMFPAVLALFLFSVGPQVGWEGPRAPASSS
jgi:hypothetical protein